MAANKKLSGRCATLVVICVLLLLGGIAAVVAWQVSIRPSKSNIHSIGAAELRQDTLEFSIFNADKKIRASGNLNTIKKLPESESCDGDVKNGVCLEWKADRRLVVTHNQDSSVNCYTIEWTALACVTDVLKDCYNLEGAHWYGGYQDYHQYWPLERTSRNLSAYVTMDSYVDQIGGVQERYFVSSNGTGFYVEDSVPLYISVNESGDNSLCLVSKYDKYPYNNKNNKLPVLKYTICQSGNVLEIHNYMSKRFISRPKDIPDELMFRYPIWSTWAQYHKDINQSIVLEFANAILHYNFSHAQIEIDDDWTPKYGDMYFNKEKFPDPREMVQQLKSLGFRVTIWIHPFANIDSMAFLEGGRQGFFVRELDSRLPALVSWWGGEAAALLDVTNPNATSWFLNKLKLLQNDYNITSFKFDAGEVKWLPNSYSTFLEMPNPNMYSTLWAELAYRSDMGVRNQETRVGANTQDLPIFVRMLDKLSLWGYDNGLKTLIPCALTFGILGYPFILPDMIGGNAYEERHPTKELFVRWLEATTFLPSMQFSIVPWQYDEEVVNISRYYTSLHEQVAPQLIALAKATTTTGAPIIRPLWWIAPNDEEALTVDSEFLVGDEFLVAPVLDEVANERDVYLPAGSWKDELRGDIKTGGQWYRNYSAELHELPRFTLLKGNS